MNLSVDIRMDRGEFDLAVKFDLASEVTALFGASGAGKTTLLHSLAGLTRPDAGRITFGERVLFDAAGGTFVPAAQRRIGVLFQDLRLFPHLSVEGNLLYGHRLLPPDARKLPPEDVVAALELAPLLTRRPDQLSGGERQRVALGRTLLAMPELLLMDEPLAALDARLRRQILPYLRWVHESLGIPILYVSHSLPEILELTDQVVVLHQGRVTGHGEVFDVLGRTLMSDDYPSGEAKFNTSSLLSVVAEWIHEEGDFIRGRIGDQEVILPFARMSPGQPGRVAVGPDDVMLARERLPNVSARNQLRGVVERISPLHGRLLVHLRLAADAVLRAELTRAASDELDVTIGTPFYCVVKTSSFEWQ